MSLLLEDAGIKDPHHTQQDEKDRESCEQILNLRHLEKYRNLINKSIFASQQRELTLINADHS